MPVLFRLVYVSRAAARPTAEDVARILRTSRARNALSGVTGVLFHWEGTYAQLLEGPVSEVEQTFWRIEQDPRHTDVTAVLREPVDVRCTPDRPMGFFDLDAMDDTQRRALGVDPRNGFRSLDPDDLVRVRKLVFAFRNVLPDDDALRGEG